MTLFWVLFTHQLVVSQNESSSPSTVIEVWKDRFIPFKSRGQHKEARDLFEQGRYEAASQKYVDLLEKHRSELGEQNSTVLTWKTHLAYSLCELERFEESKQLYEELLDYWTAEAGVDSGEALVIASRLGWVYLQLDQDAIGERYIQYAYEKSIEVYGVRSPHVIIPIENMALLKYNNGQVQSAIQMLTDLLDLQEKTLGESHYDSYETRYNLGVFHYLNSDFEKAGRLLESTYAFYQDEELLDTQIGIYTMVYLGGLYEHIEQYTDAIEVYSALNQIISEGPDTMEDYVGYMLYLPNLYHSIGEFQKCIDVYIQMLTQSLTTDSYIRGLINFKLAMAHLSLHQYSNAEIHLLQAESLVELTEWELWSDIHNNLGKVYYATADYSKAYEMFRELLDNQEHVMGLHHPDTFSTRYNLAFCLEQQNKDEEATQILENLLYDEIHHYGEFHRDVFDTRIKLLGSLGTEESIVEGERLLSEQIEHLGSTDESLLYTYDKLSKSYLSSLDFQKAEEYYWLAHSIVKLYHGETSPLTLESKSQLAKIYRVKGDVKASEKVLLEIIETQKIVLGEVHPDTLESIHSLVMLYNTQGRYAESEMLALDLLEKRRMTLGRSHKDTLSTLNNLGYLYLRQGRYKESLDILYDLLWTQEAKLGPENLSVLITKNNIASNYMGINRPHSALELMLEIYEIQLETKGKRDSATLRTINNLGEIYKTLQKYEESEYFLVEALNIYTDLFGPEHPKTIQANHNLGGLFFELSEIEKANRLYNELIPMAERVLGEDHPDTLMYYQSKAFLMVHMGDIQQALHYNRKSLKAEEQLIERNLYGSQTAIEDFIQLFRKSSNTMYALHLDKSPNDLETRAFAFEAVLKKKGRIQDAQARINASIRSSDNKQVQSLLIGLNDKKREEARLLQSQFQDGYTSAYQLDSIRKDIADLQRQLSVLTKDEGGPVRDISIQKVQAKLPQGGLLLEFVTYRPPSVNVEDVSREDELAVFALSSTGDLTAKKLGTVQSISKLIKFFQQTRHSSIGKQLFSKLIEPILPTNGQYEHLLISPDGLLNVIPFEALQNANGEMLIDNFDISYLSTGRDILRNNDMLPEDLSVPVVIANPMYSTRDDQVALPATQFEADVLKQLYPSASIYTQSQATVQRLSSIKKPQFLHIATHGFFEEDDPNNRLDNNPMTRSGLILAGTHDEEDVTRMLASEAVTLDLDGTELVVLSACESGLGKAENGEGVYGMRRALALAGAKSQLVSLWSVDDDATAYFMESFYTKLKEGKGKAVAMKETKLEMRSIEMWENPKYWAAFVLTGDWK